jgi:hypothetical protein
MTLTEIARRVVNGSTSFRSHRMGGRQRDEWTVIPEMGPHGPRPCAGVRTFGKQIYYQLNPGYRGLDRVIF